MNALTKTRIFLSSWKNLIALGTLFPLGAWIYSRVWMVNPAILGDEYLYSMNARKAALWDPSPAGDFSNYLFNFVYQGTNLCGESFYTCGKIFNLFFFLGFVFTLFLVAIRFIPFWAAYGFMIAAGLSPLSVYTSMFLPESMYMFFIGLLLVAVLHAMMKFSWQNWSVVGAVIGLASLIKPHAWLSAIAVGITLLVVGLGNRNVGFKKTFVSIGTLIVSAAITRVIVGFIVGGPKALGFFGQYLGVGTIGEVIEGPVQEANSIVESSPITGAILLFPTQFSIHLLVIIAMMAIGVAGTAVAIIDVIRLKKLTSASAFALFAFIWLFSLMVEIVIFTGWVTGGGDDHTSRVLLRYYEFLFVIVPLAGLASLAHGIAERTNIWVRWILAISLLGLLTPAFTGFFSSLTIQIADAPTLAGLVVNRDVFNAAATFGFMALLLFATFPRYSAWTYLLLLPVTLVGTGWQIQEQYQIFRGELSIADKAGLYIRDNLEPDEISKTWIVATTRFEATNIAIWADNVSVSYDLFSSGTTISENLIPQDARWIVATDQLTVSGQFSEVIEGEGFTIYQIAK